jgi:hypothetical protein
MNLEQFYVKEVSDTLKEFLPGSDDRWWVKVRALNNRERREREQLMVQEKLFRPKNERALKQAEKADFQETALQYMVARLRDYEYETCIEDFVLPYVPKGKNTPVDFSMRGKTREDLKLFYDGMPPKLAEFVEDLIAKVNKENTYQDEAEEIKNEQEPSSEGV